MNEIFNLQRFGRLFYKHTTEHYKSYLMSLAVLTCVLVMGGCLLVFMLNARLELGLQLLLLAWVVLFTGTIFTSTIFADLGNDKKALSWLALPATHFEKYLVAWIYSFIVFLAASIGVFYLVMLFLLNVKHFPGPPQEIFNLGYTIVGFKGPVFYIVLLLYGFFHSIAFYGAIYFKKLHFIKTALAFFGLLMMLIIVNNTVMQGMIHRDVIQVVPFTSVGFMENSKYYHVNAESMIWIGQLVYMILAFTLWTAAYFRLKEKQV